MLKKFQNSEFFNKKIINKEKDLTKTELMKDIDLVGRFDWVEVLDNGNLHIMDFKTGRSEERKDSWQLPIYQLLAQKSYQRKVAKTSYWYLEKEKKPITIKKVNQKDFLSKVKKKALDIKEVIDKKNFHCSSDYPRCYWCRRYETIVSGKAEYVGTSREKDLFFLADKDDVLKKLNDLLSRKEKEILDMRLGKKDRKKVDYKEIDIIKKKIKDNLTKKEINLFVKELEKNGSRF